VGFVLVWGLLGRTVWGGLVFFLCFGCAEAVARGGGGVWCFLNFFLFFFFHFFSEFCFLFVLVPLLSFQTDVHGTFQSSHHVVVSSRI